MTAGPLIRAAGAGELARLRAVERASGALFAAIGMDEVADDEPMSEAELEAGRRRGDLWVAEEAGEVVGFALVEVVDDAVHLQQLSVDPASGRRGTGTALLDHVCAEAGRRARPAVTLSTFRHVPWNGPFYAARGFRALGQNELGPELAARRAQEAAAGLDPAQRVCMRRDVGVLSPRASS